MHQFLIMAAYAVTLIFFVSFVSPILYAQEVKPRLNKSGPDAINKFCAGQGYPVKRRYVDPCARVGSFTAMHEIFSSSPIKKGNSVRALPYADISMTDPKLTNLANVVLENEPVTALLIWRRGKIHTEVYQYDRKPTDLFISFSMHKTVTGLLVDVALQNKKINSISDSVTDYLKFLRGTDWENVSIKNALRMSSGLPANQRKFLLPLLFKNKDRATLLKKIFNTQKAQAGESFLYNDANTYVLGMLTEEVYRKTQGDLISEFLWHKIGPEADAAILTTKSGQHLVSASMLARPRDYLRLGLLILEDGLNYRGDQTISPIWIKGLFGQTKLSQECPFGRDCSDIDWGYSQQAWLPPYPNTTALIGKYGQLILVSKDTDTVLVMLSVNDPKPIARSATIRSLLKYVSTE